MIIELLHDDEKVQDASTFWSARQTRRNCPCGIPADLRTSSIRLVTMGSPMDTMAVAHNTGYRIAQEGEAIRPGSLANVNS
jgi:hypothetical protein